MTSLLLIVIMYTQKHARNDGQNDQSLNLLQRSLRSLDENKNSLGLVIKKSGFENKVLQITHANPGVLESIIDSYSAIGISF